jgi:hypothetical protein
MRPRTVLRGSAIVLSAAVALLGLTDAGAQEAPPALGGYQGTAASSGLNVYYLPQGALPLETLLDLSAPDALATITSGPTTFARASAADPGDLLASPETLLTNASPDYPAGTVPNYPYRVSATSGYGAPTAQSEPAPGLRAAVEAGEKGSAARATMPRAEAPAVATFGSMSAQSTTSTDGSTVTVHVKTMMSDFNLLGMLVIDSVVTDLTATSDGTATKLTGGTTISGASVLGTPVTIDEKGIHGSPEDAPDPSGVGGLIGSIGSASNPLAEVLAGADGLNEVLSEAGIRVTVARPVEQTAGTEGQRSSGGLRIDFELSGETAPILVTLTDLLPPIEPVAPGAPGVEDLVAFARANHLTRLEVARGMVSLAATPGFTYEPLPVASPIDGGTVGFTPVSDLPVAAPAADATAPGPSSTPVATTPATAVPDVPFGAGVGALAALALLVQPFLGARLARFSTAVLAAGDTAGCPLEEHR